MREFPPFRLDTVNQCLWRGDDAAEERILLAPKAFDVLRYLVEHPDDWPTMSFSVRCGRRTALVMRTVAIARARGWA